MREIIVISGKGGTGKTSLTAAFAHLASPVMICDLDVDAPDLHLILHPEHTQAHVFMGGHTAKIDAEKCTSCGLCQQMCRFDAIAAADSQYRVNPLRCEGCSVCVHFCPEGAIAFPEKQCGHWYTSQTRFGPMMHAQLFASEENSGKLVALLRSQAKENAKKIGMELILSDGPPGIGCPVISSLSGVSYAVLVTEPTPSGRHDLERVASLCTHFGVPAGVIINKSDLNQKECAGIESYCKDHYIDVIGELPFDAVITRAMVQAKAVTEFDSGTFSNRIRDLWTRICEVAICNKN
jgi:MinD superfamily P-loop ATPase